MNYEGSKREERQLKIRSLLVTRDYMTIPELCKDLGCSEATARNDLAEMEQRGLVKRVYGGVMCNGNTSFNAGIPMRLSAFIEEKEAICRYAMQNIISPGQTIILDAGTTCTELARQIADLPYRLIVMTNSLTASIELTKNNQHILHLAAGLYDHAVGSFHSSETFEYLGRANADVFFLCPNGISKEVGLSVPDQSEAEIKKIFKKSSRRTICLADHSKLDKMGFCSVCQLSEVDLIVTDERANPETVKKLIDAGAKIEVAPISTP